MNAARNLVLKNLNDEAKRSHINLIELPAEITTCILQWLSSDDLFNLRATCHTFKACCDNLPESFLYGKIFASRIKSTYFVDMFRNATAATENSSKYDNLVSCIITHCANKSNFDRLFSILLFAGIHIATYSHGYMPCPIHGFYYLRKTPAYRDENGAINCTVAAFMRPSEINSKSILFCAANPNAMGLTEVVLLRCHTGMCAFHNVTLLVNTSGDLKLRACLPGAPILLCDRCGEPLLIGTEHLRTCATCHRSFCKNCVHRCYRGCNHVHCNDCQVKNPCARESHKNNCDRCDCSLFATVIEDFISKKLVDQTCCQRCFERVCHRCGGSWSFRCDDCHLLRRVCNKCHDGIWPHTDICQWCYEVKPIATLKDVPRRNLRCITEFFHAK